MQTSSKVTSCTNLYSYRCHEQIIPLRYFGQSECKFLTYVVCLWTGGNRSTQRKTHVIAEPKDRSCAVRRPRHVCAYVCVCNTVHEAAEMFEQVDCRLVSLPIYFVSNPLCGSPACPSGKPYNMASSERVQLSGTYNVRKGKLQLPVNRWSRRHVILCGTCLMVASIKAGHAGKMHILPLIGGKVTL